MRDDFQILLIDDSPADARIIARALAEGDLPHRLTVVTNGMDALSALSKVGDVGSRLPRYPDLILLDLNLPGMDGEEVLRGIKTDTTLRVIPVVIFTTSGQEIDVSRSYQAGANTFIRKPEEYPKYRDLVRLISTYWNDTASRAPIRPAAGPSAKKENGP